MLCQWQLPQLHDVVHAVVKYVELVGDPAEPIHRATLFFPTSREPMTWFAAMKTASVDSLRPDDWEEMTPPAQRVTSIGKAWYRALLVGGMVMSQAVCEVLLTNHNGMTKQRFKARPLRHPTDQYDWLNLLREAFTYWGDVQHYENVAQFVLQLRIAWRTGQTGVQLGDDSMELVQVLAEGQSQTIIAD